MKVWLISSKKRYSTLLFHYFSTLLNDGDERVAEFDNYNEFEVIQRLRELLFTESENSLHLTLIVDEEQTEFLDELYQLIIRAPFPQSLLRVIIFSDMKSWYETYPGMTTKDLGGFFISRKNSSISHNSYKIENSFSQLEAERKIRSNLILSGLLYGGDGLDLKDVLRQIWNGGLSADFLLSIGSRRIPCIHYQKLLSLISTILFEADSPFGYLVPAFDWEQRPFVDVLNSLNQTINIKTEPGIESNQLLSSESIDNSPGWNSDITNLVVGTKSISNALESKMEDTFSDDWKSFLDLAGLQPANILVCGPPKSGKTALAKELSQRLQLTFIDVVASVISLLNFEEASFNLEPQLDLPKILESQLDLKTVIQQKMQEGKKPGKDKTPSEPPPIDISLINDAFCQGISQELLKKSISFAINTNQNALRRGFVLDIWDRSVFESIEELQTIKSLLMVEQSKDEDISRSKIDLVLEMTATEKALVDKQIEIIGPANMKSKESQAAIKALETQLSGYFTSLVEIQDNDTPIKSHPLLVDFEKSNDVLVIRTDSLTMDYDKVSSDLIFSLRSKYGRGFGWLIDVSVLNGSNDIIPENVDIPEKNITQPLFEGEKSDRNSQEIKLWTESTAGIAKIDEFLTVTVLPVLSKALIEAVRKRPDDPILYVAKFLSEVSSKQQFEAVESAKKRYEELLIS